MKKFELDNRKISDDGKYVLRTGKIFEAGEYPDKKFKITKEELKKAVDEFKPVHIDVEHKSSVWDGLMGTLQFVDVNDEGEMYGGALIPRAVDELLGGSYKVSATWSGDKKLIGLGVVKNPRISDAALFTAHTFSASTDEDMIKTLFADMSQTWDGRSTIQKVHDNCARSGAVCDENNVTEFPNYYYSEEIKDQSLKDIIEFVSKEEASVIQKLHDAACTAGAKCSFLKQNNFSKGASGTPKEKTIMTKMQEFKDALLGLLKQVPDETDSTDKSDFSAETKSEAKTDAVQNQDVEKIKELENKVAEFSQKETELAELKSQLDAIKTSQHQEKVNELNSYVKGLVGKKILPTQEAAVTALFSQLFADDNTAVYEFSVDENTKLNRVGLVQNIFDSLADIEGTEEKTFSGKVLNNSNGNTELEQLQKEVIERAKLKNAANKK